MGCLLEQDIPSIIQSTRHVSKIVNEIGNENEYISIQFHLDHHYHRQIAYSTAVVVKEMIQPSFEIGKTDDTHPSDLPYSETNT